MGEEAKAENLGFSRLAEKENKNCVDYKYTHGRQNCVFEAENPLTKIQSLNMGYYLPITRNAVKRLQIEPHDECCL